MISDLTVYKLCVTFFVNLKHRKIQNLQQISNFRNKTLASLKNAKF
jgi:hypothetical protein